MSVSFLYPEFEVIRNENRCIACRVCERQCANEVHFFSEEKGVMLSDVQVMEWMDSAKPPVSIEDVLKKDGTPRAGKLVCSLEELNALIGRAHQTAVRLTEEIRRGNIAPSPIVDKSNIARCRLCAFAGVCRRDSRTKPLDRRLPDVRLSDLLSDPDGLTP